MKISLMIKRIISVVLIVAFFMCFELGVGELLTPITYATYFNHDMEEIEAAEMDADILFIGASRVYRSFIPEVFEDEMGLECVINAASASQPFCATYYSLKDMIERVHPKRVVLGVSRSELLGEPELQAMLSLYDRLTLKNKVEFALDCFEGSDKLYVLDTYRYRNNVFDIGKYADNKKKMIEAGYRADWSDSTDYYSDTGYVYSEASFDNGNMKIERHRSFSEDRLRQENIDYLDKMVSLCEENGIKLEMVTGPTSLMAIYNTTNYEGAVKWFSEYAASKGITYHNLNYLKPRDELFPDSSMQDFNHVNYTGAETVSEIYADILMAEDRGEDVSDLFYADLEEMKSDINRIAAVGAKIKKDGTRLSVTTESLHNDDVTPLYQIEIAYEEDGKYGDYSVVSEWSALEEYEIEVNRESGFKIKVRAKTGNPGETVAYQVYKY